MAARAYVLVEVQVKNTFDILKKLESMPEVVHVDAIMGPYDLIMEVQGSEASSIGHFVLTKLSTMDGVENTMTLNVINIDDQ
jgi:DNA-binding Lrp family transcriptional regulator